MQRVLLGARQSRHSISRHLYGQLAQVTHQNGISSPWIDGQRHGSTFTYPYPPSPRDQNSTADEDVALSELADEHILSSDSLNGVSPHKSPEEVPDVAFHALPRPNLYGKWQSLSLDVERLTREIDANRHDDQGPRLIDQPETDNDIELWSCLLDFALRRMGRDGVVMLWQSIFTRRTLYQVEGPLARSFWSTILSSAVKDERFLRQVVEYAEWMYETHYVKLPHLYHTVISHFLRRDDLPAAKLIVWHFILMPSFGPNEEEFVDLMKEYLTTQSRVQHRLKNLYIFSVHRKLYDIIIPYLYSQGHAGLARRWREIFVDVNDTPLSLASRPFLRHVAAYYTETKLTKDEMKVAGLVLKTTEIDPISQPPTMAMTGQNLSYLVNRVHGETFGIQEKSYNDRLGAKWFASSWVGLDFAINVMYTMGIQGIGPLSLQSIALREGNAKGVLHRIDQLRQLKIELPKTNYVRTIRHYAVVGDDESLLELLRSDIHPDVFDDELAQEELLDSCARTFDWKTYQLILRTRLAVSSDSVATASDRILECCVRRGDAAMALQVLQEMSANNMRLAPMTSHILSSFILQNLSRHTEKGEGRGFVDMLVSIWAQLLITRFPPAIEVWQAVLYRLGREQRLDDVERLAVRILDYFFNHTTSDEPMWFSHMADIPPILRSESPYPNFQQLPRDLNPRHEKHHLAQIFDGSLQNSIVRWGFIHTRYNRDTEATAASVLASPAGNRGRDLHNPADFHFARGIRLLAMLRDRGLAVDPNVVRKQATRRLVDLYRGEGRSDYEWPGGSPDLKQRRSRNRLHLAEAKQLCDKAWGSEVVPSLFELNEKIDRAEQKDLQEELLRRGGMR